MFDSISWKYEKPTTIDKITYFEKCHLWMFPDSFVDLCTKHNGGKPSKIFCYSYINNEKHERAIKRFLSFNEEDKENIWAITFNHLSDGHKEIPFAIDMFGNLFCFDSDFKIVFYNHESDNYEAVSDSFESFMESLYERMSGVVK